MADNPATQLARFLVSGALSAAINLAAGVIARRFGVSYGVSIVVGFVVGTFSSFVLNRNFTFRAHDERQAVQAAKFTLVSAISIVLAYAVGHAARSVLEALGFGAAGIGLADAAHIITIGIITVYNFLTMKYFAFMRVGGHGPKKVA